ncbi:MAG: tetratricopeptide repeat protein [Tannerella sp.]|jgi:tetratricopeptide (TPR) repeat protein|nr:tetratricopeptide repeat protein [Tannerella sp.]
MANLEEIDKVLADLNKAIEIKSDDINLYVRRADLYIKKGEYDKALMDCDKAITLDPNYINAYMIRGGVYYEKKEYDLAEDDCKYVFYMNFAPVWSCTVFIRWQWRVQVFAGYLFGAYSLTVLA